LENKSPIDNPFLANGQLKNRCLENEESSIWPSWEGGGGVQHLLESKIAFTNKYIVK